MELSKEECELLRGFGIDPDDAGGHTERSDSISESEPPVFFTASGACSSDSEGPVVLGLQAGEGGPGVLAHAADDDSGGEGLLPHAGDCSAVDPIGSRRWSPGHDTGDRGAP